MDFDLISMRVKSGSGLFTTLGIRFNPHTNTDSDSEGDRNVYEFHFKFYIFFIFIYNNNRVIIMYG